VLAGFVVLLVVGGTIGTVLSYGLVGILVAVTRLSEHHRRWVSKREAMHPRP
jgi:hypothetical protein